MMRNSDFSIGSTTPPSDEVDAAARQIYADWVDAWRLAERFIFERLHGTVDGLTPRRLVLAAQGWARPDVLRPLFFVWVNKDPIFDHKHYGAHAAGYPLKGHVYINGAPWTSVDDGHYHTVAADSPWTSTGIVDFGLWL